jgi:hypothetical protein
MYESTYLMLLYFEQKKENKKNRNQLNDNVLDTYPPSKSFINQNKLLHNRNVTFKRNIHTDAINQKNYTSIKTDKINGLTN